MRRRSGRNGHKNRLSDPQKPTPDPNELRRCGNESFGSNLGIRHAMVCLGSVVRSAGALARGGACDV